MQNYELILIVIIITVVGLFYLFITLMSKVDSKIDYRVKKIKYNTVTVDTGFSYISVPYYSYQKNKKSVIQATFSEGKRITESIMITELFSDSNIDKPLNFYENLFLREMKFKYSNNYEHQPIINKFENIHNSAINGSFNQTFSNINSPIDNEICNNIKLAINQQQDITPNDLVYLNYIIDRVRNNETVDVQSAKSAIEIFSKYQPLASLAVSIISLLRNLIS